MWVSPGGLQVWAYRSAVDLRKGFNGLYALVERELGRDVMTGDVFVFVARHRRAAKLLWHDGTGLCLMAKRLDRASFAPLWRGTDPRVMSMHPAELALYLRGEVTSRRRAEIPKSLNNVLATRGMIG
jgi:transposase